MFIDGAIGVIIYVVVSVVFGKDFNLGTLLLTIIVFSISPDYDLIPYFALRRKKGWVSHHLIHYPLIFVPIGAAGFVLGGSFYLAALFGACAISHFVHDSMGETGIRWWYPFSKESYMLRDGRFVFTDRQAVLARLEKGKEKRTTKEEIAMRMEEIGRGTKILLLVACLMIVIYASFYIS